VRGSLPHVVEHLPLVRMWTSETPPEVLAKKFCSNGKFKSVPSRRHPGEDYFIDGEIRFPPEPTLKKDGTYRTVFGYAASFKGRIYSNSDSNIRLGMRRLLDCRKGEPILDSVLSRRQVEFFKRFDISRLTELYAPYLSEYEGIYEEARVHHADPHQKKALRIQAWKELQESGEVFKKLWLRKTWYKMKKGELAKTLKYARMIGDLGVAASLQGFIITSLLKEAQYKEPLRINGGEIHFCKTPYREALKFHFDRLIDPPGRFHFVYFSDDAALSIRIGEKVFRFNVDISSCDASHGPSIFKAFSRLGTGRAREALETLVDQCRTPIEIRSLGISKRKQKIRKIDNSPTLYSGATITTAINNVAILCIAYCISYVDFSGDEEVEELVYLIKNAASACGYLVSVDICEIPEDIQFLKNSPALDENGVYEPVLNLGVLLRTSGSCRGDLPGRGDLRNRAMRFQHQLLQGMYPYIDTDLVNNMKAMVEGAKNLGQRAERNIASRVTSITEYKVVDKRKVVKRFSNEDIFRRYRLTETEIIDIVENFGKLDYKQHYNSSAIRKILLKDYEMETAVHPVLKTEFLP